MLDGLLFNPSGIETTNQTRDGIPIYRGGAFGFEEWKFKILGRVKSIKSQVDEKNPKSIIEVDKKLIDFSSKVVEALEDDALRIAMEVGHPEVGWRRILESKFLAPNFVFGAEFFVLAPNFSFKNCYYSLSPKKITHLYSMLLFLEKMFLVAAASVQCAR